jgi:hypothetical protein
MVGSNACSSSHRLSLRCGKRVGPVFLIPQLMQLSVRDLKGLGVFQSLVVGQNTSSFVFCYRLDPLKPPLKSAIFYTLKDITLHK